MCVSGCGAVCKAESRVLIVCVCVRMRGCEIACKLATQGETIEHGHSVCGTVCICVFQFACFGCHVACKLGPQE